MGSLEFGVALKEAKIAAKLAQVDGLEESHQVAEKGAQLMLAAICERGTQLHADEVGPSSDDVALPSAGSRIHVVCASE